MAITTKTNRRLAFGIPLLIFLCCYLITLSPKFITDHDTLSNAILFDLLVTAPLLYLLLIRNTGISRRSVLRIFIPGILFAGAILHSPSNNLLVILKTWVAPVIEGLIIFLVVKKFYLANKNEKATGQSTDFLFHSRKIMSQVTGSEKLGNIFSAEIAVFYYALFGESAKDIDYKTRFSTYKENGLPLLLYTLLSLFLIETIGMHFIIALWNTTIAWVLTALSVYTCLQLFAHIRAIKARPTTIHDGSLEIHNGLAGDVYIDLENIQKIELAAKLPHDHAIKIALIKGLENHNIIISLKSPVQVSKIFGIKRWTDTVAFFVDKPNDFIKAIGLPGSDSTSKVL